MWDPSKPLADLNNETIRNIFLDYARFLYYDLESNKLDVVLVPAPDPKHCNHMIRKAINNNPQWYSDLYWSNKHFRRDRSINALERIVDEKDRPFRSLPFKYDAVYRELIFEHLTQGYKYFPGNSLVKAYFNIKEESSNMCVDEHLKEEFNEYLDNILNISEITISDELPF
jgi:hypothetical protein